MKVADMHCDTISAIYDARKDGKDCNLYKNHLHIDLEKMKKADYLVQNFGMFVNLQDLEDPLEHCLELIDLFYEELNKNKNMIAPALNYEDIKINEYEGKISALLTIEEGGVTKGKLSHLRNYYKLGVRMLTLTWNYKNAIGYPNVNRIKKTKKDFQIPNAKGLTEFGIDFIQEMEKLGMIIDVSHLSDGGVYDVLKYTKTPFVASHSNARGVCNHVRNLTDDMIKKMADRGCVIGMNFYPPFLEEGKSEEKVYGTIDSIVSHVKHVISVGGYECIGLGSDFDGISGHKELMDASYMPKLAEALENAGLKQHEIEGIFYNNVIQLYREVLK